MYSPLIGPSSPSSNPSHAFPSHPSPYSSRGGAWKASHGSLSCVWSTTSISPSSSPAARRADRARSSSAAFRAARSALAAIAPDAMIVPSTSLGGGRSCAAHVARINATERAPCRTLCTAVGLRCRGADALRSKACAAPGGCLYVNRSEVSTWDSGASQGRTEKEEPAVPLRFFPEVLGAFFAASSSGVGPSTRRSQVGFRPAGSIRGQSLQCLNTRSGSHSARISTS
mmetsp:Transcript_8095/g.33267  ORF Transcript_8095/g.33267 Transcript_8095/m.33267 type:complete len:228 (-) Transcript_8095:2733-3416(-)